MNLPAQQLQDKVTKNPQITENRSVEGSENEGKPLNFDSLLSATRDRLDRLLDERLAPGLYLVATPIGNLADISLRALSILARADLICCENARHSTRLLERYNIKTVMQPYHEHNAARERPHILARLADGARIALIADAGTPLISDPGFKLVQAVHESGFTVTSVPGPSAPITALTLSGLPTDRFFFEGFLPARATARCNRLKELAGVPATLLFFESPRRVAASLCDMAEHLGARAATTIKEISKLHETVERGSLVELAASYGERATIKGEFVICVGPPDREKLPDDTLIRRVLENAMGEMSLRDAVLETVAVLGAPRKVVYDMALAIRNKAKGE